MENENLAFIPFDGLIDEKHYFYVADLSTNLSRWSKNAVEYFSLESEYIYNAQDVWCEHIHPSDRQAYLDDIGAVFSGKKQIHNVDYRAKTKSGEYVSVTCKGHVIDNPKGDGKLFLGFIENHAISSHIDSITGLHNFFAFIKDVKKFPRESMPLTFVLIGINRFSDINNTYGYEIGNKLLINFADYLTTIKHVSYVYRLDGVKFCLIISTQERDLVNKIYSQIQERVHKNFEISNISLNFSVSASAFAINETHDPYSIQSGLFAALAISKKKNHSELVYFDETFLGKINDNINTLEALRASVYNNYEGFYMCYQPIIDVRSNSISGTEALVRWSDPRFGSIPPGIFIPLLENDPCFYQLGNWILKTALEETKPILNEFPDFIVHVNVSAEQFEVPSFRDDVCRVLAETGFPAKNLCLELTERVIALDLDFLNSELEFYRSLGIKISLDDFGTGVNSLNLLLHLKVDELKIERVFVKDIIENSAQQTIVKTISLCANELGLEVCVEGVENEELRDYLKQFEITRHQGYFYSKPIEISKFMNLMS